MNWRVRSTHEARTRHGAGGAARHCVRGVPARLRTATVRRRLRRGRFRGREPDRGRRTLRQPVRARRRACHARARPALTLVFSGDFNWFDIDDADFTRINTGAAPSRHPRQRRDRADGCRPRRGLRLRLSGLREPGGRGSLQPHHGAPRRHRAAPCHAGRAAGGAADDPGRAGRRGAGGADCMGMRRAWPAGASARRRSTRRRWRACSRPHRPTCSPPATPAPRWRRCSPRRGPGALFQQRRRRHAQFAGAIRARDPHRCRTGTAGLRVVYRTRVAGVHVEALAIDYDHAAWIGHFDASWPAGSPAALSYRKRIVEGPGYGRARAARGHRTGRVEPGH